MKLLYSYLLKQRGLIIMALVLATINQVFSMLDPWVGRKIIDNYLTKFGSYNEHDFVWGVAGWLGIGISVAMVSRIAKNFQDYFVNVAIQKSGANIFMDGIRHTLGLPYQVFEDKRSGETLNILQKVRIDSEKLISLSVNLFYTSIVGVVFVFFASFTVHWLIAPVFLGAMIIVGVSSSLLSRKIKAIQKNIMKETSTLAGTTTESLRNIELVKSLGLIGQEIRRISANTLKILGLELTKVKKVRTLGFVQGTTVNLLRNCLLLFLSWMVFTQRITPGMYIQFLFYTFFIFNPLQELGTFIQVYREAQVSLNNFNELMSLDQEDVPANPQPLGDLKRIECQHISFRHLSGNRDALSDVSFSISSGESIAFVGPSGSGKSTLVKLLVGIYNPSSGNLLYNGIPSVDIDKAEIRSQLGLVSQESQLFSGSLRDNLLFVNPMASDALMLDALDRAATESLMSRADKGLDTQIGEGGIKVSGGEKQRISIARALLRDPALMVFDEATSALDSITEREISKTMRALAGQKDRMNILVAHRLSTIAHADRIYVLEKGKIIEQGTHQSLIDEKGLYYAMWRQQIGETEEIIE